MVKKEGEFVEGVTKQITIGDKTLNIVKGLITEIE
jgi:hypothetical protein